MDGQQIARRLASLASRPIVIMTHKRSGTHLTIDLLRRHFPACDSWKWWGENASCLYLSLASIYDPDALISIDDRKAVALLQRCPRPTVKTHLFLDDLPTSEESGDGRLGRYWVEWLEERARKVYVFRDGRDVLASLQLLEAKRDQRRYLPLSEFIRQEVDGVSRAAMWTRHVERGLAQPEAISMRFEDLRDETRRCLDALARRLELAPDYREPLLPGKAGATWASRLGRRLGRRPPSTAILGRPEGFPLEPWQTALDPADREFFHREAGDTLIRLGYEDSDAWVDGYARAADRYCR